MATTKTVVRYRNPPKKKGGRRRNGFTLPLAVIGGFAPLGMAAAEGYKAAGIGGGFHMLVERTTGYNTGDGQWRFAEMAKGLGPILAGFLVHKLAGKLGVNRALASAGVPWVRI